MSVFIEENSVYYHDLVQSVYLMENRYGIKILCGGLFSSIPMKINNVESDLDIFLLAEDISKIDRLNPNRQVFFDVNKNFLAEGFDSSNKYRKEVYGDHYQFGAPIKFDITINDVKTVNDACDNYVCEKYPSYHNVSLEEHLKEANKSFEREERSSRIFLSRMLIYRNIFDKTGYITRNWHDICKKHLNVLHLLDMYYTTTRGNMDFNLNKENVILRKYINALNSLIAMQWIVKNNTIPPIVFTELLESCENSEVKREALLLLKLHKEQTVDKGKVLVKNIPIIYEYIARELDSIIAYMQNLHKTNPTLCLSETL
jgi:hypothetical protein